MRKPISPEGAFDDTIYIRVNSSILGKFKLWCTELGKPYQSVLREIIKAGPEKRLTVEKDPKQVEREKDIYKEK